MFSLSDIQYYLNCDDKTVIEDLARRSQKLTRQYFGRTISLYAPLYLSNFCSSNCVYCGFNNHRRLKRYKLTPDQIRQEMLFLSQKGIESILLLTGESRHITDLTYLKQAVKTAKDFFPSISLEVYPMSTKDYHELFVEGVDGITVYQETYDRKRYQELHLAGQKSDYDYRRQTPERAARAGIRQISMGVLLGLSHPAEDLLSLFQHLNEMLKNFPGVEYSLSFPRLRPVPDQNFEYTPISDLTLIKIICLSRILFPRVGINLSTRESSDIRDHAIELGVTRLSAESKTSVGGYTLDHLKNKEPQFDIQDNRSVQDILTMLKQNQFDPVFTEWRRIS